MCTVWWCKLQCTTEERSVCVRVIDSAREATAPMCRFTTCIINAVPRWVHLYCTVSVYIPVHLQFTLFSLRRLYTVRAQCNVYSTYSKHCTCTVHLWVHWTCTLYVNCATLPALKVNSKRAVRFMHTRKAFTNRGCEVPWCQMMSTRVEWTALSTCINIVQYAADCPLITP